MTNEVETTVGVVEKYAPEGVVIKDIIKNLQPEKETQ